MRYRATVRHQRHRAAVAVRRSPRAAEDCESHQERIGSSPRAEPERDSKRVSLRRRKAIHQLEKWRAQLLERRKRKLHVTLDPNGTGHPELPSLIDRVVEQSGLADSRLSVHHQRAPASADRPVQQSVKYLALAVSTDEHHSRCVSSVRDLMSSLRKALRRWYSTVLGLMNSCVAISRLVCPSAARRAIRVSWGVR
jgi:hypothetical protein